MRNVIFFPATRRGNGTGHLVRSLRSARDINCASKSFRAAVLVGRDDETIDIASVVAGYPDVPIVADLEDDIDLLVVDRRSSEPSLLEAIPRDTVVIALDEDGPLAEVAEYTVRMLGPDDRETNIRVAPPAPERRRLAAPTLPGKVLVTFGGEDPARLTLPTVRSLLRSSVKAESITVVRGPSFAPLELPPGVVVLAPAPGLGERLADYDLVLTSYGLTAFESRGAGCRTATVEPSR
jgi:spore coat polysaccharide biosynthesis predicted glycosyltransferase SpsG